MLNKSDFLSHNHDKVDINVNACIQHDTYIKKHKAEKIITLQFSF